MSEQRSMTKLFDLDFFICKLQVTKRKDYIDKFSLIVMEPEVEVEGFLFPAKSFKIDGKDHLIKLAKEIDSFIDNFDDEPKKGVTSDE